MNNDTTFLVKSKQKNADFSLFSLSLSLAIIVVMLLILISPVRYAQSVVNGLKLFFTSVAPGLLPFMFFTKLLTELGLINKLTRPLKKPTKFLFGINSAGLYGFLMSIISGYPIGAKITNDLYNSGNLHEDETTLASLLSSTSGPIFTIGAVGGAMLKSVKLGFIIWISNIIAVILSGIVINLITYKRRKKHQIEPLPTTKNIEKKKISLAQISKDSVISLLIVGFYIALFSLFIDLLTDLKIISFFGTMLDNILALFSIKPGFGAGIMSGIVEMTRGAKMLSANPTPFSIASIGFLISFSGISILMQSMSFMSSCKVSIPKFILGKLLQASLTFALCLVILYII